jgi:O-antigen/teichoic acid export membrane protein
LSLKIRIEFIAGSFVFTRLIGFIVAIYSSYKVLPSIKYTLTFKKWHEIKKQVLVFGLQLLFGSLFFQLDTLLLAFLKGDTDVGIYQAAFKLIALPLVIPDILINTLLPVLSRLNSENELLWARIGGLLNKTLTLIALPIAIILFNYSEFVIKLIYPIKNYGATVPILRIFAIILFIRFSVESYALMLTTSYRQKTRLIIVLFGTFLNLGLNYFTIPIYGPFGAAVISLVTNLFVGIGYIVTTLPLFFDWTLNFSYSFSIVFSIIISFFLWNIKGFYPIITIPIVLIVCSLFFLKFCYKAEERDLIFKKGINFQSIFSFSKYKI